jgi:hypothetical protein
MILAIVGTRTFANPRILEYASLLVEHEVKSLRWDSFVTGDPEYSNDKGVDALCVQWCAVYDRPCKTLAPKHRRWQPEGFKARNILIAVTCDEMLCIRDPGSSTYGSGWTANYADSLGKPVTRILIS